MLTKLAIAGLVVLVMVSANAENPKNLLDVMVTPESVSVSKGDSVNFVIVVTNYGRDLSDISNLYVNGTEVETIVKSPDILLATNSSMTINHSFTAENPGTYSIPITVKDRNGNTGIAILNLTVTDQISNINSTGLALDKIALLMAVYFIPAQIIERGLVSLNIRHNANHGHKNAIYLQDQKITSFSKLREKVVESVAKRLSSQVSKPLTSKIKTEVARSWLQNLLKKYNHGMDATKKFRENLKKELENLVAVNKKTIQISKKIQEIESMLRLDDKDIQDKITNKEIDELLKDGADIKEIKKFLEDKNNSDVGKLEKLFDNVNEHLTKGVKNCFTEIEKENIDKDAVKEKDYEKIAKEIMANSEFNEIYNSGLGDIDKETANAQQAKSKHESEHELRIWLIACGFALVPAGILSYFGIGVLQVLGNVDLAWRYVDAIVSALFIGSGTKPIHDIIDYIQKVRSSK